jgi:hypothetical protein
MDTLILLQKIEQVFPFVEMPPKGELVFKNNVGVEYDALREDIEHYREAEISGEFIRAIHQELSLLSAAAWQWILPYYLRYGLTGDAEYSRMEVEFFIYSLAPADEFKKDTVDKLSRLKQGQVECLIRFLEWCFDRQFWREYCGDDIERAMEFLSSISTNSFRSL